MPADFFTKEVGRDTCTEDGVGYGGWRETLTSLGEAGAAISCQASCTQQQLSISEKKTTDAHALGRKHPKTEKSSP